MTDKLRAAVEHCLLAFDAIFTAEDRGFGMAYIKGCAEAEARRLRQALDQLPDATKMIEPIGEIVEAHGLIAVLIPEMPPVGTKLYAEPPKHVVNLYMSEKRVYKSDKIKHDETLEEPPNSTTDIVESKPVGWLYRNSFKFDWEIIPTGGGEVVPLYTAPPKREWVGLTYGEVNSWELPDIPTVFEFAQFIEAKLKEKNT